MTNQLNLRTFDSATDEEIRNLRRLSYDDPWKPVYHIHPSFGLLNDPNGLAYYNGEYHAFYQWFPFDAVHGMKHWAHVKSKDLCNWERLDVAITPNEAFEKNGAYSGAALEVDGNLYLYYTGNVKYEDGGRTANQCVAIMMPDGEIRKLDKPVIKGVPEGYTGHVRDPKVFKKNDRYYMILGAQREDETGTIIVYRSDDALKWDFAGELNVPLDEKMIGFMWECPDYFELDGRDVLVFSPQGVEADGHDYYNIYNVIYVIGHLDIENLEFRIENYQELDKGFDFYAPQSFEGKDQERIMFGWAGLPEIEYPSDAKKWAHCLTLPRVMKVRDGKLIQMPAEQLHALRAESEELKGTLNGQTASMDNKANCYELQLSIRNGGANQVTLELCKSETESLQVIFDFTKGMAVLDRSSFKHSLAEEYGTKRYAAFAGKDLDVTVYADNSIVEIYINEGEAVFTSRVFPTEESVGIEISADGQADFHMKKFVLKQGIEK